MTNRELRIWNDLRPFSVGFENIFDHFNLHLDTQRTVNYPPYNINKIDDLNWNIEMALAGFSKKDIDISTADSQLTIKSIHDNDKESWLDQYIKVYQKDNSLEHLHWQMMSL